MTLNRFRRLGPCRCLHAFARHPSGGPCAHAYCECLGYEPPVTVPGWPDEAGRRRNQIHEYLQWHPALSVDAVAAGFGLHRNGVRRILEGFRRKGLARRLGPSRRPVYYPVRVGKHPFDAHTHYRRHVAPYAAVVRLLDRVGPLLEVHVQETLRLPPSAVARLLQEAVAEGSVRVVPPKNLGRLLAYAAVP